MDEAGTMDDQMPLDAGPGGARRQRQRTQLQTLLLVRQLKKTPVQLDQVIRPYLPVL